MAPKVKFTIEAFDKFSKPILKVNKRLLALQAPMQRLNLNMRSLGTAAGLGRINSQFKTLNSSVTRLNKSLKLTAIAGIAIGAALLPALRFEKAMSKVKAISGATEKEFKSLEATAKKLGETTQFSATKVAEGMTFLSMAGLDATQVLQAIPGALDLALAGTIDLGQAADIATNIMGGFNFEASEFARVADILAFASADANTNIVELGEGMKFVAPIAQSVGASIEETAAFMEILADAGIKGTMAGTGLRKMFLSLTKPVGNAGNILKALETSTRDSAGNLLPMVKILSDMKKGMDNLGLGSAQRAGALKEIFGERAVTPVLKLLDSIGTGELNNKIASLNNASGAAAKMAQIMADNALGNFALLLSALEGLSIAFNDIFGDQLKQGLKNVTAFTSKIIAWVKANPRLIKGIAKVAGMLTLLTIGILATTVAINGAALAFGVIFSPIGLFIGAAILLIKFWTPIKNFFILMTKVILGFGLALFTLANPFSLLITAPILIFKNWDRLKNLFGDIFQKLMSIKSAIEGLVSSTPNFLREKLGLTVAADDTELTKNINQTSKNETAVKIDFENAPPGTRMERQSVTGNVALDLNMGFSMATL